MCILLWLSFLCQLSVKLFVLNLNEYYFNRTLEPYKLVALVGNIKKIYDTANCPVSLTF